MERRKGHFRGSHKSIAICFRTTTAIRNVETLPQYMENLYLTV